MARLADAGRGEPPDGLQRDRHQAGAGRGDGPARARPFLAAVDRAFDRHPDDLVAAIRAAVADVLESPRATRCCTPSCLATYGADTELLPLLTTESESLLEAAKQVVAARMSAYDVGVDAEHLDGRHRHGRAHRALHVIHPTGRPEETGEAIAWLAGRARCAPEPGRWLSPPRPRPGRPGTGRAPRARRTCGRRRRRRPRSGRTGTSRSRCGSAPRRRSPRGPRRWRWVALSAQAVDVRREDARGDRRQVRGWHRPGVHQTDEQLAEVEAESAGRAHADVDGPRTSRARPRGPGGSAGGVAVRHRLGESVEAIEQLGQSPAERTQSGAKVGVADEPRVGPERVVLERPQPAEGDRALGVHPQREADRQRTEQLGAAAARVPPAEQMSRARVAVEVPRSRDSTTSSIQSASRSSPRSTTRNSAGGRSPVGSDARTAGSHRSSSMRQGNVARKSGCASGGSIDSSGQCLGCWRTLQNSAQPPPAWPRSR